MRILSVLVLGLGLAAPALAESPTPTMSLTGSGEVAAAPDMATISLGVVANARTAAEAMGQASEQTASIIAAMKAAGVEARDLQTSDLNLRPEWRNRSYKNGEAPEIGGFTATNTVTVRARDLDQLGGLLDAVVQNGANQFRGLNFGLQDPKPVQDAARRAAMADALSKALLYAEAAGVTLGPILSISEAGGAMPMPMPMMEMARMSADVPVEAGELGINAQVSVTFAISQ